MDRLESHGVGIGVPTGWEAELSVQDDPAALDETLAPSGSELIVLHAANFSLPPNRDDYGTEALQAMDRGGIFMTLIEFDPGSAGSKMFAAEGVPALRPDDFSPDQLLRPVGAQSGVQQFFRVGDRPFCLYTVIGSHSMGRILVPELNRVLAGLSIA